MSTITKEQAKDLRNAFQFWQQDYDPVEDKEQYDMFGLGMVAMDALLASLEPVSVFKIDHESSLIKHVKKVVSEANAPPAPEIYHVGDATMRHIFTPTGITDVSDMQPVFDQIETVLAGMWQPAPVSVPECFTNAVSALESLYRNGKKQNWNERYTTDMAYASGVLIACRAAMLQGADGNSPVIADGWVACSERMPGEVLAALQNVARLRRNLNDFCGDKSLIAKCLSEAEGALLNAVNRHSTMLAEPLKEAKNV
ncbi:hypothetical protein [Enterobacter cloacae]|uniref:hypothetical protein n=1 Tax=Enterobacter cloacae TaxID=550 RepID=UPI003D6EC362